MKRNHILALGAPRSGTSLLASILGRHSEAAILYEDYGFCISKIVSKSYAGNKLCIPNQIELSEKRRKLGSMVVNFLTAYTPLGGILGPKRYPYSYYSIEDYLELDNIRVVGIVRDGNDVVSSISSRGEQSVDTACAWWARAVDVLHQVQESHPAIVRIVSFEDLVVSTEQIAVALSQFLGWEYEPEMLEGYKYTPVYTGEEKIDPDRAHRSRRDKLSYDLEKRFPDSYRRYLEIMESRETGGNTTLAKEDQAG